MFFLASERLLLILGFALPDASGEHTEHSVFVIYIAFFSEAMSSRSYHCVPKATVFNKACFIETIKQNLATEKLI